MGDPTYEAMRAKERAEYELQRAQAKAAKDMAEAVCDFLAGRAALNIMAWPALGGAGPSYSVRFVRDPKEKQT